MAMISGSEPKAPATKAEPTEAQVRMTASYVAVGCASVALIVAAVALGFSLRPRSTGATAPAAAAGTTGQSTTCPASAQLPPAANDHGAAPVNGSGASVAAGDFFFSPTCVTGATAGTVTLTVHNGGQALHNVSIPDQGIDADVAPGETVTVSVRVGSTPVSYFCKFHRTSGMVGAVLPSGG